MKRNVTVVHRDGSLTRVECRPSGDVVIRYINPGRNLNKR